MAHYSDLVSIRDGVVKNTTDLWILRAGQLVPVQSAWVVKNGVLVKQFERVGVPVTMSFISPSPAANQTVAASSTLTWKVRVPTVDGLVPTGSVTFTGPQGSVVVALDAAGEASTTFVHNPGQRTVSVTLASTNGYTASQISRSIVLSSTLTTFSFVSPSPAAGAAYYGEPGNLTWKVKADAKFGVTPAGNVRFFLPNGTQSVVALNASGEASVTYSHTYGQKTVTARLEATNDFHASGDISRSIAIYRWTQHQQWQTYTYSYGRYYNKSDAGTNVSDRFYMGDLGNLNYRTIVMMGIPGKPNAGAYCIYAQASFSMLSTIALVRVGWHILDSLPATGYLGIPGVAPDVVGVANVVAHNRYAVDMTLHVAGALNNGTFRGLIYGGNVGNTPYGVVWYDTTMEILWEWYSWDAT